MIITAVFPPEPLMTAMTSADLANELSLRGHDVTVITSFPNRPTGRLISGYKRKWLQVENREGYKVIHCWHALSKKSTLLSRIFENVTFGLTTSLRILREKRPDVVYLMNWALVAQSMNSWILSKLGIRIVTSVHDIYPESIIDKKMINPGGVIAHVWRRAHRKHLDRCKSITTLSRSMVEYLIETRKLSPNKVLFLPNWMDESRFLENTSQDNIFRKNHSIGSNTFVATFAGSLTLSAGLELYIRAAELLKPDDDILILLAGDGSQRRLLEKEIADKRLKKVKVIYPLIPEEVHLVHSAANILLMSLSGDMVTSAAPSKQVGYMLSGRPVIANVSSKSDSAKIINETRSGFVLQPGDAVALAELLVKLSNHRLPLNEMGQKAQNYALENYAKSKVLPKLVNLIIDDSFR